MKRNFLRLLTCAMMMVVAISAHAQQDVSPGTQGTNGLDDKAGSLFQTRKQQTEQLASRLGFASLISASQYAPIMPVKGIDVAASTSFRGTITHDDAWQNDNYGLYEFKPSSPVLKQIFNDTEGIMHADYGSAVIGDLYYEVIGYSFSGSAEIYLKYVFDLKTMTWNAGLSEVVPNQDRQYLAWTNTPYDENTKLAYGLFFTSDGNSLELCSMDYTTFTRKKIASPKHTYLAMAIDSKDGQLYAVDADGNLYKVNKTNGSETFVTNMGITASSFHQAAVIDSESGAFYWNYIDSKLNSGLVAADTNTGETEVCFKYDRLVQFADLFNYLPYVDGKAPAGVENLTWRPNDDNPDKVIISFNMPRYASDGRTQLTGQLDYSAIFEYNVLAEGKALPGEKVEAVVAGLPKQKLSTLEVKAANSVGEGKAQYIEVWAGVDTPVAPENVKLNVAGNLAILAWDKSTEGVHGGYVDPEDIAYEVREMPGNVLKTTTKSNLFSETSIAEELTYLFYSITAVAEGGKSEPAYSNKVKQGTSLTPPYNTDFSNNDYIDGFWTIVDANDDGITWQFEPTKKLMRINYNTSDNDDWLVSPQLKLEQGSEYVVSFEASTVMGGEVSLSYGKDGQELSEYDMLIQPTYLTRDNSSYEYTVIPQETGVYRFAIHETAEQGGHTDVVSFSVSYGMNKTAPDAPTNLTVTPAPLGEKKAVISFTAPSQTIQGSDLFVLSYVDIFRGNVKIATLEDVAPFEKVTYTDENVPEDGLYTYTVRAANYSGMGLAATCTAYIGMDLPAAPVSVAMVDNGNGTVTVNWVNSSVGQHNGYVDVEQLDNIVYNINGNKLGEKLAYVEHSDKYTGQADLDGETGWLYRAVTAARKVAKDPNPDDPNPDDPNPDDPNPDDPNPPTGTLEIFDEDNPNTMHGDGIFSPYEILANGFAMIDDEHYVESDKAAIGFLIKGTPVAMPFTENFAAQAIDESSFWWTKALEGETTWDFSSISADGDEGSMAFTSRQQGDKAVVGTRKITLKDGKHPMLAFSYYSNANSNAKLTVGINRAQSGVVDEALVIDMAKDNASGGWSRAVIDLSKYVSDRYVIIEFTSDNTLGGGTMAIDDVSVKDVNENDISLSMNVPEAISTGQNADIEVSLLNEGYANADVVNITVTASYEQDGEMVNTVVDERKIVNIPADGNKVGYHLSLKATPFILGNVKLKAVADFAADTFTDNNVVEKVVNVTSNDVPAITDLVAEAENRNVKLTWSVPGAASQTALSKSVTGFNIYVDGNLYTTVGGDATSAVVGPLADGQHDIYVTVLYGNNKTESPLSNLATAVTGIKEIISVWDLNSIDAVAYTTNGAVIARGKQLADKLQKGVYIIKDLKTGRTMTFIK